MGAKRTLSQLLRRWRVHAHLDFMWVTRDFRACLVDIISDIIVNIAGVLAVFLLAERFEGIGNWSRDQIVFMLGYAALVEGVLGMGFTYNVLHISRRLGRGQLDHTLIQPQPVWMTLLTEGFMPFSGCWSLLAGASISIWALVRLELPLDLGWSLLFGVHLISSCIIVLAFSYLWGSLAFWSPVGAEEISSQATRFTSQLKSFPLDGLDPLLTNFLLTALPVGFVAWYPCRTLLGIGDHTGSLWMTPIMALGLSLLAFSAFKKGLPHYEQTGSQRYLRWGHRS